MFVAGGGATGSSLLVTGVLWDDCASSDEVISVSLETIVSIADDSVSLCVFDGLLLDKILSTGAENILDRVITTASNAAQTDKITAEVILCETIKVNTA